MLLSSALTAPDDWQRLSIADVCTRFSSGGTPSRKKPEFFINGAIPWVKTQELKDCILQDAEEHITVDAINQSSAKKLPKDTILLAMYGATVGQLAVLGREMTCNQACAAMVVDTKKADYRFLYYHLLAARQQIRSLATGAAQQNLSGMQVKEFVLAFPSMTHQKNIADTLSALDDRITLLRETNATLEAIAQALFKSWFVDFDPVRAKAEGREPEGMPAELADLFPSEFEETELGEIPKGWKVGTVVEGFDLLMGQSPPGDTYNQTEDGLSFFQGRTDFGFRFPKKRMYCSAPTRLANRGDTLVSVRAPVGDVNVAIEKCCIGRGLAAVKHKSGSGPYTLYSMKGLEEAFHQFEGEGTVFGSINKVAFQNLKVVSPPADIVKTFDEIASPLDAKIEANEQQLINLTDLRDTLLPRLMSGKLRIPDLEEQAA